jgi:hypothetical protein
MRDHEKLISKEEGDISKARTPEHEGRSIDFGRES